MSNDQSSSSQIFYDGTYKTALSNYIISVSGGGQILVSDVNNWNNFVGIKPPTDSDAYANTRQLMLVYTKPVTGDAFDTANYSWISTDAGMLKFSKAWQLLSSTNTGNFRFIDPPLDTQTYYLQYTPNNGINWVTVVNNFPFEENVKSQVLGYDATNNQAVSIIGYRKDYVLKTVQDNSTGLEFGYVTPSTLNLNYQTIDGTSMVIATNKNTFELSNIYPFSQDLEDGEIIYLDKSDPDYPYFNGIDAPQSNYQMLYTVTNEIGKIRWIYDYFTQEVAGLGTDYTTTQGKLGVWKDKRLIAKSIQELLGDVDNYYYWSNVVQSSCYLMAENEIINNNEYSKSIVLTSNIGKIVKNQYMSYGGNLEFNINMILHCMNLKDYVFDDEELDGVNIKLKFSQCNSNATLLTDGIERYISVMNIPILSNMSPYIKLSENIIKPFLFDDIPYNKETKLLNFLPTEIIISSENDKKLDVYYNSIQSKYKVKLACKNIQQSFTCKKLYIKEDYLN